MAIDTIERVRLTITEARALSERAMRGIGYEPEDARILADHVIDAALCGYEYSGLPKLLNVADHPLFKAPRSPMRTLTETSVSVLLDGGNQNGMIGMYHATRTAIERAQLHGIALVGVRNIWMSGRSAYYVEMVARAGLIGIHTVAAPPMVAPLGGARAALGTNPIAFGFPTDDDPLVI
ncbi:MAG TPA: Ldh family oxidoreductase, partial [Candidatus Binatia bacterium]|nr:Ldh family oxidoreductase [Candidatus Binatia bacterium]